MKELPTPKFKVGDVVRMEDDFHFNPAHRTVSIGSIQAIHLHKGRGLLEDDPPGQVTYTISGFSLRPTEDELRLHTT